MSAPDLAPPPQELLDFLTQEGVDPATVSFWRVIEYLLRRLRTNPDDRATIVGLLPTAQAEYQQLQADIAAWPAMTAAQRQDAMLRTMQTLATVMQVVAPIIRILKQIGA